MAAVRSAPQPGAEPWAPPLRTQDWFRGATRWTQLTFAEDDPADVDLDFWVEVMRRTRSNALCLSAGGYIAYYPTAIAFHHRSAELGDTDPFGALVEQARRLGMHVMARVDPHAVHADAAEAHPEWLARHPDGSPIEHWAFPGIWLTDPFSSYHRDFITDVAREIVTEYDVDAVFANRWEGYGGVSYADHTARAFRDATGLDLPHRSEPDDPAWPAFGRWRSRRLSELVVHWDDAVRAIRPHARFIPNRGAMLTRDLVRDLVDDRYPFFVIDKQGRSGVEPLWTPGRLSKRSRGLFPDRPVNLLTSVGPEYPQHRWKDSVDSPAELITWVADGFIHGGSPWFTKFNATVSDDRWVEPIAEVFATHQRLEPVLTSKPVRSEVAILDNVRLDPADLGAAHGTSTPQEDGFYQALLEARIGFDYIAEEELSAERLAGYRVLILADADNLSDGANDQIRAFVAGGGSVVAAHASTTEPADRGGTPQDEPWTFGLADLFGVQPTRSPRSPVKNNYIAITDDHPVTAGFTGARRIIGGTGLVGVTAEADTTVPFRFIPDYPDLPMEEVYPRQQPDDPAVICREHRGGGRTVYLAFNVGEVFWDALQHDHQRLITGAVDYALGGDRQVRVHGPGLVDLSVRADDAGIVLALVNLTNPMTMRGQLREILPLGPQQISVAVPAEVHEVTASSELAGEQLPVRIEAGRAELTLPALSVVEAVRVQWS